jgi:hypothetical protein
MMTHENYRSRPGSAESRFYATYLVKKWRIANPKNDVCKKSGGLLFSAKVQNHSGSSKNRQKFAQNSKITPKGCRNETRAHMCIPCGLIFMCGVFPSFWFHVSVAASQKTLFRHSKNGKSTFRRSKRKSASVAILAIPTATHVFDMASFWQTMPCSEPNLAHLT